MRNKAFTIMAATLLLAASAYTSASERPKVFVSGTDSGGGSTASETSGHLIKVCPELTVTLDREKADYTVVRDDTGAGPGRKPQKVTVFNHDHDLIYAGATRSVKGAAKEACKAILDNWKSGEKRQ